MRAAAEIRWPVRRRGVAWGWLGAAHAELLAFAVTIVAAPATPLLKDVWTIRLGDAPDRSTGEPGRRPTYALARD